MKPAFQVKLQIECCWRLQLQLSIHTIYIHHCSLPFFFFAHFLLFNIEEFWLLIFVDRAHMYAKYCLIDNAFYMYGLYCACDSFAVRLLSYIFSPGVLFLFQHSEHIVIAICNSLLVVITMNMRFLPRNWKIFGANVFRMNIRSKTFAKSNR